jgi:hypothetical protein
MALVTRTYARPVDVTIQPEQLAALIGAALSRPGLTVGVQSTTLTVSHPTTLDAGDDAAVNAVIAAYAHDPDFGLASEVITLHGFVSALRQWSDDADAAITLGGGWVGTTYSAGKDAILKVVITRLGRLCDRMADVLERLRT